MLLIEIVLFCHRTFYKRYSIKGRPIVDQEKIF